MKPLYTLSNISLSRLLIQQLRQSHEPFQIVFCEDGVYKCQEIITEYFDSNNNLQQHKIYALNADVNARGITLNPSVVHLISYDEFVNLIANSYPIIQW